MLKLASMAKEDTNQIYIRANAYLAKGCLELAEDLYFRILHLYENGSYLDQNIYADIHHNLGMIAEKRRNFNLAIDYYHQSVGINKKRSMTWLFLAKLYLTRFEGSRNQLDLKAGLNAIDQAEADHSNYPIAKLLKAKYALP